MKFYRSSSTRNIENPSNFINHNSEKVISRAVNLKNILEISEETRCVTSLPLISFLKTERMFIYGMLIFASNFSVAFLCNGIKENIFQQSSKLKNKATLLIYTKFQGVLA